MTPLCKDTALLPSGEMVNPNGSCVIMLTFPAGATYLPLGSTDIPVGLMAVSFPLPGTCSNVDSWAMIVLTTKKQERNNKNKRRMVHHLVHNISKRSVLSFHGMNKPNQTIEIGLLVIIHGHMAAIFTIEVGPFFEL